MSRPEASVVIPTLDRCEVVVATVRSVLAQRDVASEVVVVDDGSRDGTSEALAALGSAAVRVVRHERPRGLANARNAGIAAATAPWIALLDDDDHWAPDKLRAQLAAAEAQAADFVYSAAVTVGPDGIVTQLLQAPDPDALRREIRSRNAIPAGASNVLVRAELVRRVGAFDPALAHLADWDLWIRLTEAATPGRCADVHVAYMLHASNMHLRQAGEIKHEARYLQAKHASSRLPGRLDAAALDGWAGWANVRAGRHLAAAACFARALGRGGGRGYGRSLASALLQATGLWRPARRLPAPDWLGAA